MSESDLEHREAAANDDAAKQATSSLHACVFDSHIGPWRTDSIWENGEKVARRQTRAGELRDFSLNLDGQHYDGIMNQDKAVVLGAGAEESQKVFEKFKTLDFDHLPSCNR